MSGVPAKKPKGYRAIAETLFAEIREGKYAPGDPFPSLTALMRRFGVSRITAKRAVDDLKRRRVVRVEPRSGATVTEENRMIGMIVLSESPLFQDICSMLSGLCQQAGYALLLGMATTGDSAERARRAKECAEDFAERGVTGVIFQPIGCLPDADRFNAEITETLRQRGIPLVLLDGDIVPVPERSGFDTIEIDNYEAGSRLARHILSMRPKATIAFLSTPYGTHAGELRRDGIRTAAVNLGGRETLLNCDFDDPAALAALLRKVQPDAVICAHDALAARTAPALRAIGRRIPEDVLLASFDDTPIAAAMDPPLTVIRQSSKELARMAFATLMQRIVKPQLPPHRVLLEAPLVIRQSTSVGLRCAVSGTKSVRKAGSANSA